MVPTGQIKYRQQPRGRSINACLLALGAKREEVYHSNNDRHVKQPHRATQRTIYDYYSKDDLRGWATYLYIEQLKKWHPDNHQDNKEYYTRRCQELSEVYQQALHILTN